MVGGELRINECFHTRWFQNFSISSLEGVERWVFVLEWQPLCSLSLFVKRKVADFLCSQIFFFFLFSFFKDLQNFDFSQFLSVPTCIPLKSLCQMALACSLYM